MTTLTPKQQALFDQCCEAIDAGTCVSIHISGRSRPAIMAALRERYPEPIAPPIDPLRKWIYDTHKEANKLRNQIGDPDMGFVRLKHRRDMLLGAEVRFPFLVNTDIESGADKFRDLFIEAQPTTSDELKNK